MKPILTFFFVLITMFIYSQNNYKVVEINEKSTLFKGTINGSPITMYLENKKIMDCDINDTYVDGWYYYDKYKTKIYLSGFSKNCDLKLFNFGKNHFNIVKKISANVLESTIDSLYEKSNYQEALKFDRCNYSEEKVVNRKGTFENGIKKSTIIINSNEIFIGKEHEYFRLPNAKDIDLLQIFNGYGGNKFYSLKQDKSENRAVFYFHSISNHNACGMCGASDGEKGYRIIYFDKNWNIKRKEEFTIESCLENIYNTKILKKSSFSIKYSIKKDSDDKLLYYLIVDKSDSKINKTKIK